MNKKTYHRFLMWKSFLKVTFLSLISMNSFADEMTFQVYEGISACKSCNVIIADGVFTNETGDNFEKFLKNKSDLLNKKTIVVLNSSGGSLYGGLELGRIFRTRGLDTHIGTFSKNLDGENFVSAGECSSSCALAFLGGTSRSADTGSKYGLHQFSTSSTEFVPLNQAVEGTQSLIAKISEYLKDVDASQEIIPIFTQAKSSDMKWLTDKELSRLRIYNSNALFEQQAWKNPRSISSKNIWSVESKLENGAKSQFLLSCEVIPRSGKVKILASSSLSISELEHPYPNSSSIVKVNVVVSGKTLSSSEEYVYFMGNEMGFISVELPSKVLWSVVNDNKPINLFVEYGAMFPEDVSQINYVLPLKGLKNALETLSHSCEHINS